MTEKNVDQLNIGLIIISLLLAILFPFELFLFSYAFLGPLHYLTEINWLQQKKYFTKSNSKYIFVLVILTVILTIPILINHIPALNFANEYFINLDYVTISIAALFFSIALIILKNRIQIFFAIFICIFLILLLKNLIPVGFYYVGVFLPTIIHVYLFTIAFMLFGSLKNNSKIGFITLLLVILVPIIIIYLPLDQIDSSVSNSAIVIFIKTNFLNLNNSLASLFSVQNFHLTSEIGIKIQIFIAFAYTYHYLNWFSKTSIIGWKQSITKNRLIAILIIWVGSVCLYLYDYQTGLIILFFLSILHVYLEFPLNIMTIRESYRMLKINGLFSKK